MTNSENLLGINLEYNFKIFEINEYEDHLLVLTHFDYFTSVWKNWSKGLWDKLQRL